MLRYGRFEHARFSTGSAYTEAYEFINLLCITNVGEPPNKKRRARAAWFFRFHVSIYADGKHIYVSSRARAWWGR